VPYDGVRYHLKEWLREGVDRPQTKEELFNLRHASLRNTVERLFGVFKRKFKIVGARNEYSIERQIDLVYVLAVVFNFIAKRDREDQDFNISLESLIISSKSDVPRPSAHAIWAERRVRKEMDVIRDTIASKMWSDYQQYRN